MKRLLTLLGMLGTLGLTACTGSQTPQETPPPIIMRSGTAMPAPLVKPVAYKPPTNEAKITKDGTVPGIRFGRFGTVTVYKPKAPTHAVLFLSGDGGWNQGVVDMAQILYRKDFLVIGIDTPRYFATAAKGKERCLYPPGDLQALAQVVQKRLGIRHYLRPMVVGYSSGATLAYAALVAAPPGTFAGAISLGFCPDIDSKKPLCKGDGLESKPRLTGKNGKSRGYDLLPYKHLPALWVALHGRSDQLCSLQETAAFTSASGNGRLVALDQVGHGFGVKKRWQMEFERAVRDVTTAAFMRPPQINTVHAGADAAEGSDDLSAPVHIDDVDLPLIEVKAPIKAVKTDYLAVLVSGDGGWAGLDRDVADGLADAGVPVIGLDSLQYFWRERTPEGSAADLQKLLTYYLNDWHKQKAIILGYSFGAEVVPFMVSRLNPAMKAKIPLVGLISPSQKATFEFQVADWFGGNEQAPGLLVAPEMGKLKGLPRLCFYGGSDSSALCPRLQDGTKIVKLPGSHRLGDSSDAIAEIVLKEVGLAVPE